MAGLQQPFIPHGKYWRLTIKSPCYRGSMAMFNRRDRLPMSSSTVKPSPIGDFSFFKMEN